MRLWLRLASIHGTLDVDVSEIFCEVNSRLCDHGLQSEKLSAYQKR